MGENQDDEKFMAWIEEEAADYIDRLLSPVPGLSNEEHQQIVNWAEKRADDAGWCARRTVYLTAKANAASLALEDEKAAREEAGNDLEAMVAQWQYEQGRAETAEAEVVRLKAALTDRDDAWAKEVGKLAIDAMIDNPSLTEIHRRITAIRAALAQPKEDRP